MMEGEKLRVCVCVCVCVCSQHFVAVPIDRAKPRCDSVVESVVEGGRPQNKLSSVNISQRLFNKKSVLLYYLRQCHASSRISITIVKL